MFPSGSNDAMVLLDLEAGSVTVHVKPADGITRGEVLFEIYALTVGKVPPTVRLSNLSVRTKIAADNILIVGLTMRRVYETFEPRTVLVRAMGPALSQFGVTNAHTNPMIQFYTDKGLESFVVRSWELMIPVGQEGPPIRAQLMRAHAATGAFPLSPGSKDAAVVLPLAPQPWTAHVKPADGVSSGEVLFELYDIPESAL